jgi:dihydroorotase
MNVLLKKATIISASSPFHRQVKDILIIDGIIKEIKDSINHKDAEIVSGDSLHVSIGWMDIFADFGEPGNEHKETLETGSAAAAVGGFTDLMLMPDAGTAVSSKDRVEFLTQRSATLPINIHPIGTVTKNAEGNELAEMYDMHASGAVAFSDGRKSIQQSGILLKGLQYLAAKNAVLIQVPDDKSISSGGLMNEGITSTNLGLPGNPAIAEELMVARDISLLEYTDSKLHITGVSTEKSLGLITEAKKAGLQITCSVTPYHLVFCDEDLVNYDTNLKVNPPLRTRADMEALQQAFLNGDIDCIASHHAPQCSDDKVCEFEYAKNGMISLQTLFGAVNALDADPDELIKMLTENPRNIFGLDIPALKEGAAACLSLFEPATTYIFEENMIRSKSKNSPFVGKEMKGRVIGIINKNKLVRG